MWILFDLYILVCDVSFWNIFYFTFRSIDKNSIDLFLLGLLSTNHSQMFLKSLFNCFSVSLTSFAWETKQELAYRNRFDFLILELGHGGLTLLTPPPPHRVFPPLWLPPPFTHCSSIHKPPRRSQSMVFKKVRIVRLLTNA